MMVMAQTDAPILVTKKLVKRFGGLVATDCVSLTLFQNELHALIGPNGAGKSTLIGQLTGEIMPNEGEIWLQNERITHLATHSRAARGIGRSYQVTQIFADFTVLENVAMALLAKEDKTLEFLRPMLMENVIVSRAYAALKQVGLQLAANRIAGQLAHGEHRQLELAMALALQPKVLILDEPLAGMSGAESDLMIQLLRLLKQTYPILLVEHDMDAVFALADRISVLVYGKIIATGSVTAIRNDEAVRSAYLGEEGLIA